MKSENVLLTPISVVTIISPDPGVLADVIQVIVVSLTTIILVASEPPNVTTLAPVKYVPVIVTEVPPSVLPDACEMLVIIGGVI